jgi:ankyrin repeat protein
MLPPKEADLILREALKNCDGIDWKEIDFLAAHGADITRTFQNDPPQPIARFALECDKGFKSLVVRGLRMDAIYDDEPKVDKDEKVPLMLYFLYDPPTQRADVIEAMLRQSNNANGPPKCDPCDEYPLSLALTGDDSSIVRVLLKFGADPNKLDKSGEPSFLAAAVRNKVDLLDLMQSKANLNVNQKDESGISPLAWTICNNATDSADWLKRHGAISFGQDICEKEIAKKSDDAKQK